MTAEPVRYWQVNVPENQRTAECPEFLTNLSKRNIEVLETPDANYHRHTWPEVQEIIKTNRLDALQRVPSDLRRYFSYNFKLKKEYGSVMNFVLQERLKWTDLKPRSETPFSDPEDLKVLYNDWPYGIDKRIVHLVVWTKFAFDDDPVTADLTSCMRKAIDDYVNRTFCKSFGSKNVIWFRNWKSLKSIHSIEHLHVMLYNPCVALVNEITNGDVPLSDKVD